jgi:3-phosphoshikimate 1-carboxyvinyltransferase
VKISARKSNLKGTVLIPASKSHTIRAVVIGSLADGVSAISNPLGAADPVASVRICGKLGARIEQNGDWIVRGVGGRPIVPDDALDAGNSGTTLYITMGTAALVDGYSVFTGDEQIRSRPAGPLIEALRGLGVEAFSTRGNGKPPLVIRGPMKGGSIELDGSKTSQYLSALLLNCPIARGDTEIRVRDPVELPFIEMTLGWLDSQGIRYERDGFERFNIPGGQAYHAFDRQIPGDFSSAAFFLCAAAITGSELTLLGLDMNDSQGDKAIVGMLRAMGAKIEVLPEGIRITGGKLVGGEFDLAGTPDALPAMAVTACFAEGETRLVNVAQARLKETDRITVMRQELLEMGARIEELPDGLVIHGSELHSARVQGHSDHRVVMALAVAGLACDGTTEVDTAEAVSITFPTFVKLMQDTGAESGVS